MAILALYARVSKAEGQNVENQLIILRKWAESSGNTIEGEYYEEISTKENRPVKEYVLAKIRRGEIDGVAFTSLDRWGRTMSELVLDLEEFTRTNKIMVSLKENIDLSNSAGRLYANILSCFANFERDRIRERTMMGLARTRSYGTIIGVHPIGCGCGKTTLKRGIPFKHNGTIMPIRDENGVFLGWDLPKNHKSNLIAMNKSMTKKYNINRMKEIKTAKVKEPMNWQTAQEINSR